eukprot:gene7023-4981_t
MMMRRMFPRAFAAASCCATTVATRDVACKAVLRMPTPSSASPLGKAVSLEEVANVYQVPPHMLPQAKNPRLIAFTQMDLARSKFAPLISTLNESSPDLRRIAEEVEEAFRGDNSKLEMVAGARAEFESKSWSDVASLIRYYEEVMYPIRAQYRQYKLHELNSFHMKDVLKRGLAAFKQEYLDEQKALLDIEKAGMDKCEGFISAAVAEAFTTDICNDIANILRVAGEKLEHAHAMAVCVLEDMNMMKIPHNEVTREIVQAVSFNDGPFDNSALLFEIIEYPERGEVSIQKGDLETISNNVLKLISKRHQTPLDDGVLLRSSETHPNLQRSPE